jgi:monovalent cation/hydrogen antiporter
VKRLGVQADTGREKEFEKELAVRAAKAAKRRLREIEAEEDLPEELSEQMSRRALDIGLRISPDLGEDERREDHEHRVRRLKRVRRIQGEMLSAARHEVVAARSEPGADPEIVDRVLRHLDVRSLR